MFGLEIQILDDFCHQDFRQRLDPDPTLTRLFPEIRIQVLIHAINASYCMSKKSWPILYSILPYEMGQDFTDMH